MPEPPEPDRQQLIEAVDLLLEQVEDLKRRYAELADLLESPAESPAERVDLQTNDPIRLIAIDMALAGNTRDEVETYVRGAYGVSPDPDMLDGVFKQVGG